MERLADQQRMRIAFLANAAGFVTGLIGWRVADSTDLLADTLGKLAGASAYVVTWLALTGSLSFKQRAARWSGCFLVFLGFAVLIEAGCFVDFLWEATCMGQI